jgi:hypothetical protein
MLVLGEKSLLNEKLTVILNSSQSKTPCGRDHWITRTSVAAREIIGEGDVLVTSTGMFTWELVAFLASAFSGPQVILSPGSDEGRENEVFEHVIADFGLDRTTSAMLFPGGKRKGRSSKENWPGRDREALAIAQKIVPVAIKAGGRLDPHLKSCADSSKIDRRFQIDYASPVCRPAHYDNRRPSFDINEWDCITHWTKTRHGPWPGEARSSFYSRLLTSEADYPNSAFNTLKNIVLERTIRASTANIRDAFPAIGFTECRPDEIMRLIRWCPRKVNWNFEPYGIAISKDAAKKIGAKPVIYGTVNDYKGFSESAKPYFQYRGGGDVDWSREREWRVIGGIDLSQLCDDQIIFFVWRRCEAEILKALTPCAVMAFEGV